MVGSANSVRKPAKPAGGAGRRTLSRADWIAAATAVLERRGIANVKIDALARQLKVTRGSFYFHFANQRDLLSGLMATWRERNCAPFLALGDMAGMDGLAFFDAVTGVWISENPFSPQLDLAVRDWARSAPAVAREVQEQDDFRMALLVRAFEALGFDRDESLIRARITYFQQIGYYATSFKEPAAERKRFRPLYTRILTGTAKAGTP